MRRWPERFLGMVETGRRALHSRDYFRVEDEAGERFWIYRSGDGEDTTTGSQRWFLHGSSDERGALCRAAMHLAFFVLARCEFL